MTFANQIVYWVTVAISVLGMVAGVIAFADATIRRPDAFTAADKQTKFAWLAITGLAGLVLVFGMVYFPFFIPAFVPPSILWIAAIVGSLVYLLDVRPQLREVSGGNSRW